MGFPTFCGLGNPRKGAENENVCVEFFIIDVPININICRKMEKPKPFLMTLKMSESQELSGAFVPWTHWGLKAPQKVYSCMFHLSSF